MRRARPIVIVAILIPVAAALFSALFYVADAEPFLARLRIGLPYYDTEVTEMARRHHHGPTQCTRYVPWEFLGKRDGGLGPVGVCQAFRADPRTAELGDRASIARFGAFNAEEERKFHDSDEPTERLAELERHANFLDRFRVRINREKLLEQERADESPSEKLSPDDDPRLRDLWKDHKLGPIGCRLAKLAN